MSKQLAVLILFLSVLWSSCSEDFKVNAPYKNVMIVYGLLNAADTAQYIKINRGFYDAKGNNLLAAQNPDSLYFNNLDVKLEERNPSGNLLRTINLDRVNLVTEGIAKDSGIFANKPSYAYKVKPADALKINHNYKLIIKNNETGVVVTSSTELLSNALTDMNIKNFLPGTSVLNMGNPIDKTRFTWTVPKASGLSEIYLRFHYLEEVGPAQTLKFADLPLITDVQVPVSPTGNPELFVDFNNSAFIGTVKSGIKVAPPGYKRYVDTANLIIYAGGKELQKYIAISNAQGGLTADQIKPVYTNLTSSDPVKQEVYGLFDSRVRLTIFNVPFSKSTIDTLINTPAAWDLKIVGVSPI
jgi:hypothetical protein